MHIGSVKPNIGYSEGALGIISLIKVLLMMKHGKISPQAQFNTLNPNISDLEPDNMVISKSLKEWSDDLRFVVVNNYGASGNNAAAVVAPPPPKSSSFASVPSPLVASWPILIFAASKASLLTYCDKLKNFIDNDLFAPATTPHLAFTLATNQNRQFQNLFCTTTTSSK